MNSPFPSKEATAQTGTKLTRNTASEKSSSNYYYADYIPGTVARIVPYPTQFKSLDVNELSRKVCKFNELNLKTTDPRIFSTLFRIALTKPN